MLRKAIVISLKESPFLSWFIFSGRLTFIPSFRMTKSHIVTSVCVFQKSIHNNSISSIFKYYVKFTCLCTDMIVYMRGQPRLLKDVPVACVCIRRDTFHWQNADQLLTEGSIIRSGKNHSILCYYIYVIMLHITRGSFQKFLGTTFARHRLQTGGSGG